MLQLRVLSYICSRRLSPTTSPLHVLEGPRRHVEHLPSDHLLSRSGLCLATPSVCCSRMQTGVSVHCTLLSYSAARCSCSSGVSVRCSCLPPCSMLQAGVGTKYRGTPHRLPVSVASAWPALSLALQAAWNKKLVGVHPVCRKSLMRLCLWLLTSSSPLLISGSSSWSSQDHLQWCSPNCDLVIVLLAACCPATWSST